MRKIFALAALTVTLAGCGGAKAATSTASSTPTVTVTKTATPTKTASASDRAYYREVSSQLLAGNSQAQDVDLAKALCQWAPGSTRDDLIHKMQAGTTQGSLEPSSFGLVIDAAVAAYCPQYTDDISQK